MSKPYFKLDRVLSITYLNACIWLTIGLGFPFFKQGVHTDTWLFDYAKPPAAHGSSHPIGVTPSVMIPVDIQMIDQDMVFPWMLADDLSVVGSDSRKGISLSRIQTPTNLHVP